MVNSSGVSAAPFALAGAREQFNFNYTTGQIARVPPLSVDLATLLRSEVPRYVALWQKVFAPVSVAGYKKGVPDTLSVPAADWFRANNFTALPIALVDPLSLYGYGDIRIVPILYIFQYITPDILTAFIGQHTVYYTGKLLERKSHR